MPSWLSDWVGTDMAPLAYYALVAAIILVLIVVVLSIAKAVLGVGVGSKVKSRGPRLAVMDVSIVDPKRKLVLVRRDEVEHLLLIGGQNDLVVESGILRVAPGARQGRTDPGFAGDGDVAGPVASRALPPRAVPAGPVARSASPLTRPVPRPAAPAPVVEKPAPPMVEPVSDAPPTGEAPTAVSATPSRAPVPVAVSVESDRPSARSERGDAPSVELSNEEVQRPDRTAPPAPPARSGEVEPRAVAAVAPVAAAPVVAAPESVAPVVQPPVPVEASVARAAPPIGRAPVERSVASPGSSRETPASSDARPVEATPVPSPPTQVAPAAAPIVAERPTMSLPLPVQRPMAPEPDQREAARATQAAPDGAIPAAPRKLSPPPLSIAASAAATGPSDPLKQPPAPPTGTVQPRSMATPTLPLKTPPVGFAPNDPARPTEVARGEVPALGSRDADRPIENVSSAEPSPEEVLARLLRKAGTAKPAPVEGRTALPDAPFAAERAASPAPAVADALQDAPAIEAGERRPLSVRSFASVIQGRQSAPDNGAAPVTPAPGRVEPRVIVPPLAPAPSAAGPASAPVPGAPPVKPGGTAATPPLPSVQPATSWDDEEEEDLGDFLSAQLDDQLNEDIWTAKDAPAAEAASKAPAAAPVVRPPDLAPQAAAAKAEPIPPVAPPAPKVDPLRDEAPPRRQLTLEEEMERLLGDFDIEMADRRVR